MTVELINPALGAPPIGRLRCSEQDIADTFVNGTAFAGSTNRSAIWSEYEQARDLLRSVLRVHAVWFGGSFTTSELNPHDIDATFVISRRDYSHLTRADQTVVESFMPLARPPFGQIARTHPYGLVDSYVVFWQPWVDPQPMSNPMAKEYFADRGFWDDFWQRSRTGPKGAPAAPSDAFPVRGYLEVILDAFAR